MSIFGKYKENFKLFKNDLRKISMKKNLYNYIMLKIRKSRFDAIEILNYIDLKTEIGLDIFVDFLTLELSDKNIIRKNRYKDKTKKRLVSKFKGIVEKLNIQIHLEEKNY
jgi:hypothetical protein